MYVSVCIDVYTWFVQTVSRILNFRGLRILDFWFFVALCWYSYPSLMQISSNILYVQLIFDSYFTWTYFGSSSIFAYSKNESKILYQMLCEKQNEVRGCIPYVDCCIRWRYLGPKQRLAVVQNVLRRLRRCERQITSWTPEHVNNRQKHWWSEENTCIPY